MASGVKSRWNSSQACRPALPQGPIHFHNKEDLAPLGGAFHHHYREADEWQLVSFSPTLVERAVDPSHSWTVFSRLFHNLNENMPSYAWCPGLIASCDVPTQEEFPTRSGALFYFLLNHSGLWVNKISFPTAMFIYLCKKLSTYLPKWSCLFKFPPAVDDNFCCSVSLPSFFRVSGFLKFFYFSLSHSSVIAYCLFHSSLLFYYSLMQIILGICYFNICISSLVRCLF